MAELVDQWGNPLKREKLVIEEAAPTMSGVRSIMTSFQTAGMDPSTLGEIMRRADEGDAVAYLEMAEQIEEKDAHYLSVLGTRKRAVGRLNVTVEAADKSVQAEADAKLVRDFVARQELQGEIFDMLDAIGKGFSVTETIWQTTASKWTIKELKHRTQKHFQFDKVDGERLYLTGAGGQPEELTPYKYIIHRHQAKSGLAIKSGAVRVCSWMYLFKNFSMKDWVVFAEAYGQPIRIGTYGPGASEADKQTLMRAIANIGSDFGAIIPDGMDIKFIETGQKTASADMFERLARICDEQISKAVLGQTTTTDAASNGLAGNQAHNEVRGDICDHDAVQLSATLNRDMVPALVALNHGVRERYPIIKIGNEERVDTDKESLVLERMIRAGARVSRKAMQERFNLPDAENDEDVMTPLPTAAPTMMSRQLPVLAARSRTPDAIDEMAIEMAGEWQEVLDPIMSAVDQAMAEATSFEDFNERLLALSSGVDMQPASEKIARVMLAARLAGNVGAKLK